MKVPIKEAIATGDWLVVNYSDGGVKLKLRLLKFNKINPKDVEDYNSLDFINDTGELWLLRIDIINIHKTTLPSDVPTKCLFLYDQDDCEFEPVMKLNYSDYGKKEGIIRYVWNQSALQPKIKTSGAFAFFLPNDVEAEYYISTKFGTIQGA